MKRLDPFTVSPSTPASPTLRVNGMACAIALLCLGCAHAPPPPPPPPPPAPAPKPVVKAPEPPKEMPGEEVLDTQPSVPPLAPFQAPVPDVVTLKNGLKVYLVERPGETIEALGFVARHGAIFDPPGKEGLASLSAAMLETGSAGKTQLEIANESRQLGATLAASAGDDSLSVSISGMPDRLAPMVRLLAEVALRPNLRPAEWKKLQGERLAELLASQADPRAAAGIVFTKATYPDHPLGHAVSGIPDTVKAITLKDVRRFLHGISPKDTALIAVGGAKKDDVVKALTAAFGRWRGGRPTPPPANLDALPASGPRLVMVDYPGKPQSVLRVGEPAVPRSSPLYMPLELLDSVLGGSFTSRLNQNLREQHGYTYGAFSRFAFGLGPGPFTIATSVQTPSTGASLGEIFKELDRAATQPISDVELNKGKALLAFDLVQGLERADSAAGGVAAIFIDRLPADEFQTFVPRLNALTIDRVQEAAKQVLHPEKMTVVIAGDGQKALDQLAKVPGLKLPAPQWRGPFGKPVPAPHPSSAIQ